MIPLQPSDYQALQKMVEKSHLSGEQKQEAWRLLKSEGLGSAERYVTAADQAYLDANAAWLLRDTPIPYRVWGRQYIEEGALKQMKNAAYLPIAVAGALMPDAHQGYGLPIGGVLATENAVIPYAVGVDIACRMMLTVYPVEANVLQDAAEFNRVVDIIHQNTIFGANLAGLNDGTLENPVLDEQNWQATELLRRLRQTAIYQLGTSGGGNHFADVGAFTIEDADNPFGLAPGAYLALLTHSGSRGVGYRIATHYSRLAKSLMPGLDASVAHLAWLSLDSEAGQEYWHAMELAGAFASANHHVIHQRFADALTVAPVVSIENHHNFAWKEQAVIDGEAREVIVHRKGATPAGEGVLGIIPGTMADKGYVVSGKGNAESLQSASHGGGRVMSRTAAKTTITPEQQAAYLAERGVTLIGGGLDESPHAYKRIETVIAAQADLVDVIALFQPVIVRMAADTVMTDEPMPPGIVADEGD